MEIIIYRLLLSDVKTSFEELVNMMLESGLNIIHDDKKYTIYYKDFYIEFWCGDFCRMGGIRPKYYMTDNTTASEFLRQGACKVGGIEIYSFDELLKKII